MGQNQEKKTQGTYIFKAYFKMGERGARCCRTREERGGPMAEVKKSYSIPESEEDRSEGGDAGL